MAGIAHPAERKFVALEVRGSSPLIRPIFIINKLLTFLIFLLVIYFI